MFAPAEIISIIASYVPTSSIGNFRLTNKDFAAAGLPYLTASVTIKLLPESYSRLTEISQHPIFHRYVTEIVLIKDVAGDCPNVKIWQNDIHRWRPWPTAPKVNDPPEMYRRYAALMDRTWGVDNDYRFTNDEAYIGWRCQEHVRAQQEILLGEGLPQISQCFADALQRLPRLRTIRLAGCLNGEDSLGHRRLALEHQQRYKYSESLSTEGLLVGAEQLRRLLMCAGKSAMTKILHLSAYELHPEFFNCQDDGFRSLCIGSSSLRSLDLDFGLVHNQVYSNWFGQNHRKHSLLLEHSGFKHFLNSLTNLTSLKMQFVTSGGLRNSPQFKNVLVGVRLPLLRSLEIAVMQTRSKEFLEFFSGHATCLKRIGLKDICLMTEESLTCWSDVLDALRCNFKLETFTVGGTLETLLPVSQISANRVLPKHPNITVNELLTGFVLDRDQEDILGTHVRTNVEIKSPQKLELVNLKVLMDSVREFE